MSHCSASRLTCLDCNFTFRRDEVKGHTQCVTEHEKYAEGKTKAAGFKGAVALDASISNTPADVSETLPKGPPWMCRQVHLQIAYTSLSKLSISRFSIDVAMN